MLLLGLNWLCKHCIHFFATYSYDMLYSGEGLFGWTCFISCILDISVTSLKFFLNTYFFSTLKTENHFLSTKCLNFALQVCFLGWEYCSYVLSVCKQYNLLPSNISTFSKVFFLYLQKLEKISNIKQYITLEHISVSINLSSVYLHKCLIFFAFL